MRGAGNGEAEMSGDTQGEKGSSRVQKRVEIEEKAALREGDGWYMKGRCREREEKTQEGKEG